MALKRVNVYLEEETVPTLQKIARQFESYYGVSASDLIRFALHEFYGIKFTSVHIWEDGLKEKIRKFRSKKGGKNE